MSELTLRRLGVDLDGIEVLADVDATVPDGAFAAVVGASGSGKSTLLRTVAGLTRAARGRIEFDGVDVVDVKPGARDIAMVFQGSTLLPHRNVRRNVAFPLEVRHQTRQAIHDRVSAEVRALHIEHLLTKAPRTLSRGEEQMVQIARALVRSPRMLLLDEPFAPLDETLRHRMRSEIRLLQSGYGVTTLMATNDPQDVFALASYVLVLGPVDDAAGAHTVKQVGSPLDILRSPVDLGAASAVGALWTIDVSVTNDGAGVWLTEPTDPTALRTRAWSPALRRYGGHVVTMGLRADDLVRDPNGDVRARLERIVPASGLMCRIAGRHVLASGEAQQSEVGHDIRLRVERSLVFDPATGDRIA